MNGDHDLPWFPFNPSEFLMSRKMRRCSASSFGIYILLLSEEWLGGPLPTDMGELKFMTRWDSEEDIQDVLDANFVKNAEGLWQNVKLENIRNDQLSKRDRAVESGRKGGKASAAQRLASQDQAELELDSKPPSSDPQDPLKHLEESRVEESRKKKHVESDKVAFEEVWKVHRKGPKKDAFTNYRKAVANGIDHDTLLAAVQRYVKSFKGDFTGMHLFRWIRDDRWEEDVGPARKKGNPMSQS